MRVAVCTSSSVGPQSLSRRLPSTAQRECQQNGPGGGPGRSTCVPCGRFCRLSSPATRLGIVRRRGRYVPQLSGEDSVTLTSAPSVAVTSTLVLRGSKQKFNPRSTKAPVASVVTKGSTNRSPPGEYT